MYRGISKSREKSRNRSVEVKTPLNIDYFLELPKNHRIGELELDLHSTNGRTDIVVDDIPMALIRVNIKCAKQ